MTSIRIYTRFPIQSLAVTRLPLRNTDESGLKQERFISGFFAELRRRRVIRVIIFYAIAGWIVIEVTSTVLPGLNLPDWTTTMVILLVALGFVIVIMLAWAFDIGPGVSTARRQHFSSATGLQEISLTSGHWLQSNRRLQPRMPLT